MARRLHCRFENFSKCGSTQGEGCSLLTFSAVLTDTNTGLWGNSPLSLVTNMKSKRWGASLGNATLQEKKTFKILTASKNFFGCPTSPHIVSLFISGTQRNVKQDNPLSSLLTITHEHGIPGSLAMDASILLFKCDSSASFASTLAVVHQFRVGSEEWLPVFYWGNFKPHDNQVTNFLWFSSCKTETKKHFPDSVYNKIIQYVCVCAVFRTSVLEFLRSLLCDFVNKFWVMLRLPWSIKWALHNVTFISLYWWHSNCNINRSLAEFEVACIGQTILQYNNITGGNISF